MRKAIFGGTFDPIHNGHMYIAEKALEIFELDKIIFMPSGNPPHKTSRKITEGTIRYNLVKEAINGIRGLEASDYEVNKTELSFTYVTLELFNEMERNTIWYFLVGADCLMEIESWRSVDRIFKASKLIVFNRPGYDKKDILLQKKKIEELYNTEINFLDIEPLDLSSTKVRTMIKKGIDIKGLVPEKIYTQVKEIYK